MGASVKRSPIRPRSKKQAAKARRWMQIKAEKQRAQLDDKGFTYCERCGFPTEWLELHHIEYAGRGGEWTEDNALLLCAGPGSCHDRQHSGMRFHGERIEGQGKPSEQGGSPCREQASTSPPGARSTYPR